MTQPSFACRDQPLRRPTTKCTVTTSVHAADRGATSSPSRFCSSLRRAPGHWWLPGDSGRIRNRLGLAPARAGFTIRLHSRPPGEHIWLGTARLRAIGDKPVALESAELVDLTPGLEVVGIWPVNDPCLTWPASGSGDAGDFRRHHPTVRLYPVSDVVVAPSPPGDEWCIVAEVVPTRVGCLRF